jgi:putative inorganic carbon (hco3(-)) transporter
MNIEAVCNKIIRWGFYLLVILVPLIFTPWNYELFEYNKMMVTYFLATIIIGAWFFKMANNRRLEIPKTPLDIPIGLFALSQFVSALFSMDRHISWFGYYSRFNGGMWSVITYVLIFYAFVSHFRQTKDKTSDNKSAKTENENLVLNISQGIGKLLKIALGTAVAISSYAVAEHFGIDKQLWVQDVQNRVFSTLGQPNWLSAYVISLFPISLAYFLQKTLEYKKPKTSLENRSLKINYLSYLLNLLSLPSIIYLLISLLFFITAIYTRSRAGLLALLVTDILFWFFSWLTLNQKKLIVKPIIVLHVILAIFVFVNGTYINQIDSFITIPGIINRLQTKKLSPVNNAAKTVQSGTALEYGGTESGTIRKYVWEGALTAWKSSPKTFVIGTGTETFAWAFFRYRPVSHNMVSEWDFLYNKAHNEYLNFLATTGIFGLGSYLTLLGTFIYLFIKSIFKKSLTKTIRSPNNTDKSQLLTINDELSTLLPIAIFSGFISILITNFFGFSVVITQIILFLFIAIFFVLDAPQKNITIGFSLPKPVREPLKIVLILFTVYLVIRLGLVWYADTRFASGYHYNRANMPAQAESYLRQAVSLNPAEPIYHDELASTLATLTVMEADNKNATDAGSLAKSSINESNIALTISPNNVNFWKTRTKIYYTFSQIDPQFNKLAIDALTKAQQLSPNDPKIYYNLAILYGRAGTNNKAIELLQFAKKIKPNYRDAYYALYAFYTDEKKPNEARSSLEEYLLKVDPNDKDFQDRIK